MLVLVLFFMFSFCTKLPGNKHFEKSLEYNGSFSILSFIDNIFFYEFNIVNIDFHTKEYNVL